MIGCLTMGNCWAHIFVNISFWEVKPPLSSQKGIFLDKIITIFSQLAIGSIKANLRNSGKKMGHDFPSLGKY